MKCQYDHEIPKAAGAKYCSKCGDYLSASPRPSRYADYGDFTKYQAQTMIADYCREITLGLCGWGIPFTEWVELKGIARHDKRHRLISMTPADESEQDHD